MTTSTAPHFTVRSGSSSVRALFIAAFCAFIVTAFIVDVNSGASSPTAPVAAELRT